MANTMACRGTPNWFQGQFSGASYRLQEFSAWAGERWAAAKEWFGGLFRRGGRPPGPGLIGVPEAPLQRAVGRLYAMEVGGKPIVESVEAYGSRAGGTFRGRVPRAKSDLDLLVVLNPLPPGHGSRELDPIIGDIASEFRREAGFNLGVERASAGLPVTVFREWAKRTPFIHLPRR